MNGYNGNTVVNNQAVGGRAQVTAYFPAPKPCPKQEQQPIVVVVPEQKCGKKGCCPVLSRGCDLCTNCCGDFYMNPVCSSIGITGMLNARPCIQYDEQYGSGECIGCKKDCGDADFCPYQGYDRYAFNGGRRGY